MVEDQLVRRGKRVGFREGNGQDKGGHVESSRLIGRIVDGDLIGSLPSLQLLRWTGDRECERERERDANQEDGA